ncbi:MAG: dihydroorotase [Prevotella sp.]|nr:dihydroorotase [Prevotella sp.]
MGKKTLIKNVDIVNEGLSQHGSILIADDRIEDIFYGEVPAISDAVVMECDGAKALPGIIDDHVHFREPGLTHKADIESESRAAAYGGVTSFFDMPNTVPQTTTLEAFQQKRDIASRESHVNYAFFFGATNDNVDVLRKLDEHAVPGVKLFMGSSTGNMLVDRKAALNQIFSTVRLPIMTHCEDTGIINRNMKEAKERYGDDPDVKYHPGIRSAEACYESTSLAVELARRHGARLHVAHLTTARELELFTPDNPDITAEAVIAHLMFCDEDYKRLGTVIKCNPAVKSRADRETLRRALTDGRIATVGTDHAPHLWSEKQGGCARAASGMPMIQFSLVSMLQLVDEGVLSIERVAELMCHAPARLFEVRDRGFLRPGMKADIAIVRRGEPWKVEKDVIQSKCGWSPMEGHGFSWRVEHTFCNGNHIYNKGVFCSDSRGEELTFR